MPEAGCVEDEEECEGGFFTGYVQWEEQGKVRLEVNGVSVLGLLDTGAPHLIIPTHLAEKANIKPSTETIRLRGVVGETKGTWTERPVKITYGAQEGEADGLICKTTPLLLIGRSAMKQLGIFFNPITDRVETVSVVQVEPQKIRLKPGAQPIKARRQRFSKEYGNTIQAEITKMLKEGVIERAPPSAWSSRIAVIPKPKGVGGRFIINLSGVSKMVEIPELEGPSISETCETVSRWKWRGGLDIKSSYHNFPLHPANRPLTNFIGPDSKSYRYKVLPMGWGPSASLHHHYIAQLLQGREGVTHYSDNIYYGGATQQEAESKRKWVTSLLTKEGIKFVEEKAPTDKPRPMLGRVVGYQSIRADLTKWKSWRGWRPKTKTEVRSLYQGLNWLRPFVQKFGEHAQPIAECLQKDKPIWTEEAEKALSTLEHHIKQGIALKAVEEGPVQLYTDFSSKGIGGVLMQNNRVIGLFSRATKGAQKHYSPRAGELMAVAEALKYFREMIYGKHITVITDHQALVRWNSESETTPKVMRDLDTLTEFGVQMKHVPGNRNELADLLSRQPLGHVLSSGQYPLTTHKACNPG
eukprot:GHVN01024985.1.p1 GENE.GHVN01024985.1~~GHVN01024985.1.p1  ORF type:complete len:641 (+),score=49.78 GHVN01024985.1:178-1923(+)